EINWFQYTSDAASDHVGTVEFNDVPLNVVVFNLDGYSTQRSFRVQHGEVHIGFFVVYVVVGLHLGVAIGATKASHDQFAGAAGVAGSVTIAIATATGS